MRLPSPNEFFALVKERIPARSRLTTAQWTWIGAGAALALLLTWFAWPRAQEIEAAVVDRGIVRHELTDEGSTRIHDVFVVAAPVGGELQRLELEPGDVVERGQVVATIVPADPTLLDARVAAEARATIAAAQAGLTGAQADYELARRERERVVVLHGRGFASGAALDAANASLSAAQANVAARRAELARARASASGVPARARAPRLVRSPAAGRVLRVLQESEIIAPAGAPLIEIGDPGDLEIVAEFLSQDAVAMRPGARAFIENWGGDEPIPARITRIEPYARTKISALGVEEQRVGVILRLELPQQAPPLGHGFRVDVRVVLSETANALRVPTDALVRDGAGWAVFVIDRGRARLRPVTIASGGGDFRAVRTGLREGERVVLFPPDDLASGARVRAAREPRS